MDSDDKQTQQALIPIEQAAVPFYGRELVAVRLADGRIAAVLRWLCEGMQLHPDAQVRRIRRKTALKDDLLMVRVDTEGGPQTMPALTLHGLPGWLYTIDETRLGSEEAREAVLLFQHEATDVLSQHFSRRQAQLTAASTLIPSQPISEPERPARDAGRTTWIEYHQAMVAWLEWQEDIEQWRGHVESRLESHEAILQLVPEILERLGPETLTPEHQRTVQHAVKRLHDVGGSAYASIYADLGEHFHVAKYDQIPEACWEDVAEWFKIRINTEEKRRKPL